MVVLIMGLCFFMVGSITNDIHEYYPSIDLNNSWMYEYNALDTVQSEVDGLESEIVKIKTEEGWWSRLFAGITAIFKAVTFIPGVVINIVFLGIEFMTGIGVRLLIPDEIILVAKAAIMVLITFGIISFVHRSKA